MQFNVSKVVNMFFILIISMATLASCLEPKQNDVIEIDEDVKKVISKYIRNIPDIEPKYVIHEGLSKVISHLFKKKISTFPLYKISLKFDRNPVPIPWSMVQPPNSDVLMRASKLAKTVKTPDSNKSNSVNEPVKTKPKKKAKSITLIGSDKEYGLEKVAKPEMRAKENDKKIQEKTYKYVTPKKTQ